MWSLYKELSLSQPVRDGAHHQGVARGTQLPAVEPAIGQPIIAAAVVAPGVADPEAAAAAMILSAVTQGVAVATPGVAIADPLGTTQTIVVGYPAAPAIGTGVELQTFAVVIDTAVA